MKPQEAYEKYKHLDTLLSDPDWGGEGNRDAILHDLWQAVKEAATAITTASNSHGEREFFQRTQGGMNET